MSMSIDAVADQEESIFSRSRFGFSEFGMTFAQVFSTIPVIGIIAQMITDDKINNAVAACPLSDTSKMIKLIQFKNQSCTCGAIRNSVLAVSAVAVQAFLFAALFTVLAIVYMNSTRINHRIINEITTTGKIPPDTWYKVR